MMLEQSTNVGCCHSLVVGQSIARLPEKFKWMIEELSA